MIRPGKRTLICGYKSVSNFAQDVISGVPPIELLTKLKLRIARKVNRAEAEQEIGERWKRKWEREEENRLIKTLITDFDAWLDRALAHKYPDFYITQFLSGHGSYGSYLAKRKLVDSFLFSCGELDILEHAFFTCILVKENLDKLGKELKDR